MSAIGIIGCGFVADLYMKSLATFPHLSVAAAFDRDPARLAAFCAHWDVRSAAKLEDLFEALAPGALVLNLTNPSSHFEVSRACLEAGFHVYSEKPLALSMADATTLHALAASAGRLLASAPCSVLGETAQTLGFAVRSGLAGPPRLIYAELDDDFVTQAPYRSWISESGAPWPFEDEFAVGCTMEHAGYYLTWLIAVFGAVRTVSAAAAEVIPNKPGGGGAPDYASATLYFECGLVARLTCSIVAPHDHRLRVFCDRGVLDVPASWDNSAPVRFRRRFRIRRRMITDPFGRKISLARKTHPKVSRTGAAAMNFMLGPHEMLESLREGRPCRLSADFALHLNEVTLAVQNGGEDVGPQKMQTRCEPMEPMPWAK